MNRKQWFVLGIGLILLSFFFSYLGGKHNCQDAQKELYDSVIKTSETNPNVAQFMIIDSTLWIISCSQINIAITTLSSISFTLGIIFVILGFLEPKKK